MQTARLISQTNNLRTGDITLIIEFINRNKMLRISAMSALEDNKLLKQLSIEDRQRVAYWAGVEDVKTQAIQYQLLKQLLTMAGSCCKKKLKNKTCL